MRTTLGHIRTGTRIPSALGLCTTDARVAAYVNEAQERLLKRGLWWGAFGKYRFCASNGCITLPRHVASVQAVALCDVPLSIRNEWYEFIEYGWGLRDDDSCDLQWLDRGNAVSFEDIRGVNKKIRVYCDETEAVSAQILLQGYDENGIWIRTQVGGTWYDGEFVDLEVSGPQLTVNLFSSLTGVIKPATNGIVRLYEYDTTLLTQRAMAIYAPDELRPTYRRYFVPNLDNCACANADSDCELKTVTLMVKHEYIPVVGDNDWLIVANVPAVKMACMAIQAEEKGDMDLAHRLFEGVWDPVTKRYRNGAIPYLEDELEHYLGQGVRQPIVMEAETWGVGNVPLLY